MDKKIPSCNVAAELKCPQWEKECNFIAVLSNSGNILLLEEGMRKQAVDGGNV